MRNSKSAAHGRQWVAIYYSLLSASCLGLLSCSVQDVKLQQYKVQGEELYRRYCSNCHQLNGKGLGLLYPPLDVSDFIDSNRNSVICIIKNGIQGELIVNGKSFNQPMKGIPQFTDLEIAEVTTFLYNNWGRNKGIVEVTEVTSVIQKCR